MAELSDKLLFLLDMDGTLYLDEELFDGAREFLSHVRSIGGRYLFLTNNSSKGVDSYVEKMKRLGIEAIESDFFTSVDATAEFLRKDHKDKLLYVFGTTSFQKQLTDAGFHVTTTLSDEVDTLICGFDTELTFKKLEDACILLNRGVDFIATNPDWVCPTRYGYVPDCGSVCEMLFRATGRRPLVIGKPQPEMALLAMDAAGFAKEQTILIGDRIYTDIACGVNAGIDTILVLSGESTLQTLAESETKPSFVFENIRQVLTCLETGGNYEAQL